MRRGLGCVIAAVILFVLALLVAGSWYVGVRNRLVGLDEAVNQQWAQVESQYQRRFDLIPNLVHTVQGAADFEKSTLQAVVEARARVGQVQVVSAGQPGAAPQLPNDQNAMSQYAAAQQGLWNAVSRLIVVSERYPDLKSNQKSSACDTTRRPRSSTWPCAASPAAARRVWAGSSRKPTSAAPQAPARHRT